MRVGLALLRHVNSTCLRYIILYPIGICIGIHDYHVSVSTASALLSLYKSYEWKANYICYNLLYIFQDCSSNGLVKYCDSVFLFYLTIRSLTDN